jgi:hypothetical protein
MSIDKTHFFDRIRPIVTFIMDGFRNIPGANIRQESNAELPRRVRWAVFYGPLKSAGERFRPFALNPLEASQWVLLGHFSRWSRACRKGFGPSPGFAAWRRLLPWGVCDSDDSSAVGLNPSTPSGDLTHPVNLSMQPTPPVTCTTGDSERRRA